MSERVALYPGSFDPVTFGHIDLIRRSLAIADRLVVAILPNSDKEALLTLDERTALLRRGQQISRQQFGAQVPRRVTRVLGQPSGECPWAEPQCDDHGGHPQ